MSDANVVTLVVASISTVTAFALARQAQRTAREASQHERATGRAAAFRSDQVEVVERALKECSNLLMQAYSIHNTWAKADAAGSNGLPSGSGPGSSDPYRQNVDTHQYHGTDMYLFHDRCRTVQLLAERIGSEDLRRTMHGYHGRVEAFRLWESVEPMKKEITEIQQALNDLFTSGGAYCRSLFDDPSEHWTGRHPAKRFRSA